MGWILSPTLPGYEGIPSSLTWEGPIPPDGLPAPPSPSLWGGLLTGVPSLGGTVGPTPAPAPGGGGLPLPGLGSVQAPALQGAGLGTPGAPGAAGYGGTAAPGSSDLATVLLLGLGALAVSRMKGLRL